MAIRVLGPHEQARFAPDAWGHLLWLAGSGLLTPADLEVVIDRALSQHDGRVSLDDIRALLEGAGLQSGAEGELELPTVH